MPSKPHTINNRGDNEASLLGLSKTSTDSTRRHKEWKNKQDELELPGQEGKYNRIGISKTWRNDSYDWNVAVEGQIVQK